MRLNLKPLLPMVIAALACVVMAAPAMAHRVPHKAHLTTTEHVRYYKGVIQHDRQQIRKANTVFRFFQNHSRLLSSADTKNVAWHEVRKWRAIKREHKAQLRFALRRLTYWRAKLAPVFPPHHYLWLCIHPFEAGSWHVTNASGHGGGLQLHWDWGYGISGDASNYSQLQQEWAAERAYAASNYSHSFIYGQWYEWDNADGCGY